MGNMFYTFTTFPNDTSSEVAVFFSLLGPLLHYPLASQPHVPYHSHKYVVQTCSTVKIMFPCFYWLKKVVFIMFICQLKAF